MASLYELTEDYKELLAMAEDEELDSELLSNTEKRILINLRIATRNGVKKAADRYCLE